ncbi:MAG TPA: GNAT family N-acetyltransferase [Flavobacteriaceae bacterium]|nr:GNAT family N-acetyltransferase [Flavobacteriaceae bacterium]
MNIIKAYTEHLDDLVPLFDAYRNFYEQSSNLEAARQFLKDRITKDESVIYIAYIDNVAVGFTQLYPSFSSVSMKRSYILNDLYVHKDYRKKGVGAALLNKAKQLCKEKNYKGIGLQTGIENPAQFLYENLGWEKEPYFDYFWVNQ